ncbi:MAG TPA: hypothetical protein VGV38_03120 [Pyrinomonadaceae bacterium]|nr:hypothetical protein [Pyrinomonadaceae bacterium]
MTQITIIIAQLVSPTLRAAARLVALAVFTLSAVWVAPPTNIRGINPTPMPSSQG